MSWNTDTIWVPSVIYEEILSYDRWNGAFFLHMISNSKTNESIN